MRQKGVCFCCGHPHKRLEIDHIKRVALGGSNHISNLRLLCRPCHKLRHKYDDE